MVVICAWCKRYLYWQPGAGVSHGICQDCKKKHEPAA